MEFFSNADAGVQVALEILRLAENMDGTPSPADVSMLVKVRTGSVCSTLTHIVKVRSGQGLLMLSFPDLRGLATSMHTCLMSSLHPLAVAVLRY